MTKEIKHDMLSVLRKDWEMPEENRAWEHLQKSNSSGCSSVANGYSDNKLSQLDKARQRIMKLRREHDMLLMDIFEHINTERYAGQIEQIKKDENGELDEIIIECGYAHLGKMAKNHWSLTIGDTVIGLISKNRIIISGL